MEQVIMLLVSVVVLAHNGHCMTNYAYHICHVTSGADLSTRFALGIGHPGAQPAQQARPAGRDGVRTSSDQLAGSSHPPGGL